MKGQCYYCERPFGYPPVGGKALLRTKDHIIPASQGGTGKVINIVYCCLKCNQFKADRTPDQFVIYIGALIDQHKLQPGRCRYGMKYLMKVMENAEKLIFTIAPYRDQLLKGTKVPKVHKLPPDKVIPVLAEHWQTNFRQKYDKEPEPNFHEK